MKSLVSANLLICNDMLDLCQQDGDITFFYDNKKHKLPHIHASYGDDDAIFSIEDGEILEGILPRNKRKLVEAWIEIHKDDLVTDWRLAVNGQNPIPIKPLE